MGSSPDSDGKISAKRPRRTWREGHRARIAWLQARVDQWWYLPAVSLGAGLDNFLLCFPTDVFLVTSATLRPRRWLHFAVGISLGSSLGALLFALAVASSAPWVHDLVSWAVTSPGSSNATADLVARYSVGALLLTAVNPVLPLQPTIGVAVLAGMSPQTVFLWILLGRLLKYLTYAFIAARAPHLFKRLLGRFAPDGTSAESAAPGPPPQ